MEYMVKAKIITMVDGFCGCRYNVQKWMSRDGKDWWYGGFGRFCKTKDEAYKWCIDQGITDIRDGDDYE